MTNNSKDKEPRETEDAIMERMNEALKKMMETPPETHKEMVERRRGGKGGPSKKPRRL